MICSLFLLHKMDIQNTERVMFSYRQFFQ
uniref:Uncharacterized protein n=1 Tax=Anguilla anguilla TaxID=7936 RepID=A0A0E9SXF5_ANGAN